MNNATLKPAAHALLGAALALALPFASGCGLALGGKDARVAAVQPQDFVGEPNRPTAAGSDPTPISLVAINAPDPAGTTDQTPPPRRSDDALAVNAMVGYINGEALYADQVFDVNIAAQLSAYGRRLNDNDFMSEAFKVIEKKLNTVIENKLILGEAERNLTEQQRRGIAYMVQKQREELLRFYGQGSLSKAQAEFLEDNGMTLDEHLVQLREAWMMRLYIEEKVNPKIVINDRDIERWYKDHESVFNQPDRRVFRLIQAVDQDAADQITQRLARGESFAEVASDASLNSFNPDGTGLFGSGEPVAGDSLIKYESVNAALLALGEGKHAGPINVAGRSFFVQVVKFEPGVVQTLDDADVQLKIKEKIYFDQKINLANRLRREIRERGSYTNRDEMGSKLLEIARVRYLQ